MPAPGSSRPHGLLAYERELWGRGLSRVAGVDEAGRGPLAGPVVAAAVILRPGVAVEGAHDSKTLSERTRETLFERILQEALAVGVGAGSARSIDREGIAVATARAMDRALRALPVPPEHVVIDGLPVRRLPWPHEAIVKGDARIHSIACASIVAKVVRDRVMRRLAPRYPGYAWESNKGYGSAAHLEAIRVRGATPHHRRSFGMLQGELELG